MHIDWKGNDRAFKIYCRLSRFRFKPSDECKETGWTRETKNFQVGDAHKHQALVGIAAQNVDNNSDRKYKFKFCLLRDITKHDYNVYDVNRYVENDWEVEVPQMGSYINYVESWWSDGSWFEDGERSFSFSMFLA